MKRTYAVRLDFFCIKLIAAARFIYRNAASHQYFHPVFRGKGEIPVLSGEHDGLDAGVIIFQCEINMASAMYFNI